MDKAENEAAAVEHVVERLTDAFPSVPAKVVADTVTEIHDEFADAPVRDFVPVIVEHDAKDKLREIASDDQGLNAQE
jgi:hypothetical protein